MAKSFGYSGEYNIFVMELMGQSLEDIFESLSVKRMSVKTVCMLGIQMIKILKYIHDKHIIHRDIKPDNWVTGLRENKKYIYLIDFGLAKKYRSSRTLLHYPMTQKKKLTGTARYASINALKGYEQSRRDDLEAVGYVLIYFLLGSLPWQGLPVKPKEDRYVKIMEKKRDTSPEELCKGLPDEFRQYVNYTRNLQYEEDPDYNYLAGLFMNVLQEEGCEPDYNYDWTTYEEGSSSLHVPLQNLEREHEGQPKDFEKDKNGITVVNNYVNHVNHIFINSGENLQQEKNKEEENVPKKPNPSMRVDSNPNDTRNLHTLGGHRLTSKILRTNEDMPLDTIQTEKKKKSGTANKCCIIF